MGGTPPLFISLPRKGETMDRGVPIRGYSIAGRFSQGVAVWMYGVPSWYNTARDPTQAPLDSGPVSEYGVTFIRRNDRWGPSPSLSRLHLGRRIALRQAFKQLWEPPLCISPPGGERLWVTARLLLTPCKARGPGRNAAQGERVLLSCSRLRDCGSTLSPGDVAFGVEFVDNGASEMNR